MRASSARKRRQEEEEESVFVSMTDMTVSFLFIVMLLLAFFANQYDPDKSVPLPEHLRVISERDDLQEERDILVDALRRAERTIAELQRQVADLEAELARLKIPDPLEVYINQSLAERRRILEDLRNRLAVDFPDLEVVLSEESDALRFQGDGLFRSGQASLRPDRRSFIETVAVRLQEILPCYTLGAQSGLHSECNSGFALIEAVQIEGHTDADGDNMMNLDLSTRRANETFRIMVEREPGLTGHLNFRDQPVLSVAGYGEMRPVAGNETPLGKGVNRRIDLRIIMYVPVNSDQIALVRDALAAGGTGAP